MHSSSLLYQVYYPAIALYKILMSSKQHFTFTACELLEYCFGFMVFAFVS